MNRTRPPTVSKVIDSQCAKHWTTDALGTYDKLSKVYKLDKALLYPKFAHLFLWQRQLTLNVCRPSETLADSEMIDRFSRLIFQTVGFQSGLL